MKISSKEFRVREGDEVNLKKWPTTVKPAYKSKEQYQKLLERPPQRWLTDRSSVFPALFWEPAVLQISDAPRLWEQPVHT